MSACRWFAGQPDQTSSQRDARSKERKGPSSSGDRAYALPQNYRETASQGVLEVIPTTSVPRSLPPPMLYIKSYPPSLERVSESASPAKRLKAGDRTWVPPPFVLCRRGAVFEFSFRAIHSIELKFTIDRRPDLWYGCVCCLEQTSLTRSFTSPLTIYLSITYRLLKSLASLFSTAILCFQ